MSSQDVIIEKNLEYLRFEEFWPIFCHSLTLDDWEDVDVLEAFFIYLDEGVKLRFSELGYVNDDQFAHKGDIKCALIRIRDHGSNVNDEVLKLYTNGDDTSAPPHGLGQRLCKSIGGLLLKRSDIRQAYLKCGNSKYPWAVEPGNIIDYQLLLVDGTKSQRQTFRTDFETKPVLDYGEPELLPDDAISLYPALRLLGDDWTVEEFAMQVFYGGIRAFEKNNNIGEKLRPFTNIADALLTNHYKTVIFPF